MANLYLGVAVAKNNVSSLNVLFLSWQGGMKAVVWTDVFQAGVMICGMLAIVIQVSIICDNNYWLR